MPVRTQIPSILLLAACLFGCKAQHPSDQKISLLILSGRNNHDWEATNTVLQKTFENQGSFTVDLTFRPDTLFYEHFRDYDVLVNNWNSWPENDLRWPKTAEEGLIRFLKEGGGMVFFHASSSVFYNWDEFRNISTASWEDETHHGPMCRVRVSFEDLDHPLISGLKDFEIFDELWIDARSNTSFTTLGTASNVDTLVKDQEAQPAVFVRNFGRGRIFHTILGHDTRALENPGFRILMLRGAEWAARGEVSIIVPADKPLTPNQP